VLAVSLAVGFENVGAFARAFAQRVGETPSAHRRRVSAEPRPLTSPSTAEVSSGW